MAQLPNDGVCIIHGGLRRQCETCDLAERLEAATAEIETLKAELYHAKGFQFAEQRRAEHADMRAASAESQRDQLRAALKQIELFADAHQQEHGWYSVYEMARAALGEVEHG